MWLALPLDRAGRGLPRRALGDRGAAPRSPVCNAIMLSTHGRGEAVLESDAGRSRAG